MLCLRRGALGDTLLCLPVLRWMRRQRPRAALHFAGILDYAQLLQHHGVVDRALSSESFALWAAGSNGPHGVRARTALASYAWVVEPPPPSGVTDVPAAIQVLRQVTGDPSATPSANDTMLRSAQAPHPAAPVVLHPGSGAAGKCWPAARFAALARELLLRGRPVVVTIGEVEREAPERYVAHLPAAVEVVSADSSLTLARVIGSAACFVGNDSGAAHLAAALGVPTVAVFGPTDARVWAPSGPHVRCIGRRSQGPPTVAVRRVLDAVLEQLEQLEHRAGLAAPHLPPD